MKANTRMEIGMEEEQKSSKTETALKEYMRTGKLLLASNTIKMVMYSFVRVRKA